MSTEQLQDAPTTDGSPETSTDFNMEQLIAETYAKRNGTEVEPPIPTNKIETEEEKPPETPPEEAKPEEEAKPAGESEASDAKPPENKEPQKVHPLQDKSWVESLPDEAKERIKLLEEEYKRLENDRKAAIGRAAYLQRQQAQKVQAPGKAPTGKPFVPPKTTEEWNALLESDPAAAKALESRISSIAEELAKHYEEQLTPLKEAEARRQQEVEQWQQEQVQRVYEVFPDIEQRTADPLYTQWLNGMEQQNPGFTKFVTNPNISAEQAIEVMSLFDQHVNEAREYFNSQQKPPAAQQPPTPNPEADKVAAQRREKQVNAPPQAGKSSVVNINTPTGIDTDAIIKKAYEKVLAERGAPQ